MAAQLPQPGVQVVQVFRAVSPTVVTPTLVPNVVGVGKQIVDVLVPSGAGGQQLNGDALITLPAFFISKAGVGSPPKYTGLDTLLLVFSVNNGPLITVTFDDTAAAGLTPATVVSQVQDALTTAGVTSVVAKTVGDDSWELATVGVGEFESIYIDYTTNDVVASAFGIGKGKTFVGIGVYNQRIVEVPQLAFPDPRSNLSELLIEADSVRAFLATGNGSNLQETKRSEAFLRRGTINDSAAYVGSVDLNPGPGGAAVSTKTLVFKVDGVQQSITTSGALANSHAALAADLNALTTGVVWSIQAGTDFLLAVADSAGAGSSIEIISGTLLAVVGLAISSSTGKSIEAIDDGNGDQVSPLILFENKSEDGAGTLTPIDFDAAPTAVSLTGSAAMSLPPTSGTTLTISDGHQNQTITWDGTETASDVVDKINNVVGAAANGLILASEAASVLNLLHTKSGTDSFIYLAGTSFGALDPGGTPVIVAGTFRGEQGGTAVPSKPEPGDQLWIDGAFYGLIVSVHPGGQTGVLKINKQVPISLNAGKSFFIRAMNLPGAVSRPSPDLVVSLNGDVAIKQELLRDTSGASVNGKALVYISYTAVRLDVTPKSAKPGLLTFDDLTQLDTALSPVTTANPLALGLFFALLNAPGTQVTGIGVDEISADAPFGTLDGFARSAEFLEGQEVYAIAPLTHDSTVHQLFATHVTVMSEPENQGERIVLINPQLPSNKLDTLVASGTDGNSGTPAATVFNTGIANLSALVLAAGVDPTGTIPTTAGLFLDIAGNDKKYSIQSISGPEVTIRIVFSGGDNDDGFYATSDLDDPPLPATHIQEAFAVKVRGAPLVTAAGPDLDGIASTVSALGQTYLNRRVWMIVPDQAQAVLNGLDTLVNGFYMAAAIAGMIAQNQPQQSFTNFPMTGFTAVVGSNDKFNKRQMNVMAAGGAYIIVRNSPGVPLTSRFALTTDLTSIETRTDSITKVADFTAKFLRRGVRNFIGRFNVTQGLLDTLSHVVQGLLGFLIEQGILIGATLDNIIQDEDAPDTVLIDVTLDPPFPCNFIKITLVI